MKGGFKFFKTTVVGGLVVVLPVVAILLLLAQAIWGVVLVLKPVVALLPVELQSTIGIQVALVLALLVVLLLCFAVGLIIRTQLGGSTHEWVEEKALKYLPGYTIFRGLVRQFGRFDEKQFAPAMVDLYGSGVMAYAFIAEEHDNGDCTVFIPDAPALAMGVIYRVPGTRIQKMPGSMTLAATCISQWGVGARDLEAAALKATAAGQHAG